MDETLLIDIEILNVQKNAGARIVEHAPRNGECEKLVTHRFEIKCVHIAHCTIVLVYVLNNVYE